MLKDQPQHTLKQPHPKRSRSWHQDSRPAPAHGSSPQAGNRTVPRWEIRQWTPDGYKKQKKKQQKLNLHFSLLKFSFFLFLIGFTSIKKIKKVAFHLFPWQPHCYDRILLSISSPTETFTCHPANSKLLIHHTFRFSPPKNKHLLDFQKCQRVGTAHIHRDTTGAVDLYHCAHHGVSHLPRVIFDCENQWRKFWEEEREVIWVC